MVTIHEGDPSVKIEELTQALEDAVHETPLCQESSERLRDWEMRLATLCGLLGRAREEILTDYPANDFGDALEREEVRS